MPVLTSLQLITVCVVMWTCIVFSCVIMVCVWFSLILSLFSTLGLHVITCVWDEAGIPGENPFIHRNNTQSLHKKAEIQNRSLHVVRWQCSITISGKEIWLNHVRQTELSGLTMLLFVCQEKSSKTISHAVCGKTIHLNGQTQWMALSSFL